MVEEGGGEGALGVVVGGKVKAGEGGCGIIAAEEGIDRGVVPGGIGGGGGQSRGEKRGEGGEGGGRSGQSEGGRGAPGVGVYEEGMQERLEEEEGEGIGYGRDEAGSGEKTGVRVMDASVGGGEGELEGGA